MITRPTNTEWVRNTKTGSVGQVVCRYINTRTHKPMVQVKAVGQLKDAYWLASHVEAA